MIFRDVEQKIIKDINESGMPIDAIYFIMKSIMTEIEQRYVEFCRQEDAENNKKTLESEQVGKESNNEAEESIFIEDKEGGAN